MVKKIFSGWDDVSIKNKLTISFVQMVLIPLLFVTAVVGYSTYTSYLENLEKQNIAVASMKAKNVETLMTMTTGALTSLADQECFQDMDAAKIKPVLEEFKREHPEIQNVAVAGLDGMQIARDQGKLFDVGDRDYIKEIIKGKDVFYNDAIISKATNAVSFAESVSIKKNGQLVGILYVLVKVQIVDDLLNYQAGDKDKQDTAQVRYITDTKGNVLIHPNTKYTQELTNWKDLAPVASAMNGKVANLN